MGNQKGWFKISAGFFSFIGLLNSLLMESLIKYRVGILLFVNYYLCNNSVKMKVHLYII